MFKTIILLSLVINQCFTITIDPQTRNFIDDEGRVRIFHGHNVVIKLPPYLPETDNFDPQMSLTDDDMQNMKEWGTKIVRLGVMWESVETAPNNFDQNYLNSIENLINKLGSHGIYTIVDSHQDLFSRKICGEGMPHFYTPKMEDELPNTLVGWLYKLNGQGKSLKSYNLTLDENGNPDPKECGKINFQSLYTSPELSSAFAGFFANENGILDKFMNYWKILADKYKENQYVIGYDIINEPWPGKIMHDFSMFYEAGKFDRTQLQPMYQRAHQVIRQVDQKKIIFFEPAQFPDTYPFLGGLVRPTGINSPPGPEDYNNRQSLNDHQYCCQAGYSVCEKIGEPELSNKELCQKFHNSKMQQRSEDAKRLGVPVIISEFGACAESIECFNEITSATDAFDAHLTSWAYWMFKGFGDFTTTGSLTEGLYNSQGSIQTIKLKALTRTYLHATQGIPTFMKFNVNTSSFQAKFLINPSIKASSEIYFNQEMFYNQGYKISFDTQNAQFDVLKNEKNYIQLNLKNPEQTLQNEEIEILMTDVNTRVIEIENLGNIKYNLNISDLEQNCHNVDFEINNLNGLENMSVQIIGLKRQVLFNSQFSNQLTTFSIKASDLIDDNEFVVKQRHYLVFEKTVLRLKFENLNGHKIIIQI